MVDLNNSRIFFWGKIIPKKQNTRVESGTPCAGEHGHDAHVGHEHVRLVEAARGDEGVDVAAVELPPPLVVSVVVEDAGSANWVGPKTSQVPSKKKCPYSMWHNNNNNMATIEGFRSTTNTLIPL